MTVAESIVKTLESVGVDCVFAGGGQAVGRILLPLKHSRVIKTIIPRGEQAASFMAYGYALNSGKLGVCVTQGGPGAFNALSGMSMALVTGVPLLTIATRSPHGVVGLGDIGDATGVHHTPNSSAVFTAASKKYYLVESPAMICSVLEEAINIALENRNGPVHIDIDHDVLAAENPFHREIIIKESARVKPSEKAVNICADLMARGIGEGKKLLLWLGNGCVRSDAGEELRELIDRFQIPFVYTLDGKGVLPDTHPLCMGLAGPMGEVTAKDAIKSADTLIAIGNSFAQFQSWNLTTSLADHCTFIHINNCATEINKVVKADYSIIGDAKLAISMLFAKLCEKVPEQPAKNLSMKRRIFNPIEYSGSKVHPAQLSRKIGEHLPDDAMLLGDAGSTMIWLSAFSAFKGKQNFKNPGSFGPMASMTAASLGYQLANPNRRVIVGSGDGCFQMSSLEVITAVEHKIPIIWIIFNNGGFQSIKELNLFFMGEDTFNRLLSPDFAAIAQACGANGFRITHIDEFDEAMQCALQSDLPTVIDVSVDENVFMELLRY